MNYFVIVSFAFMFVKGIPAPVGPNPTLQPSYTPSFVQPTPSSLPSSVSHSGSHSSGSGFIAPSGFPASSDAGTSFPGVAVGGPAGFPNVPSSSSGFPHSSSGFGHHSGSHAAGGSFPSSGSSAGGFQGNFSECIQNFGILEFWNF